MSRLFQLCQTMDNLDEAKADIVAAMSLLEDALIVGLPAQSPSSDLKQVKAGIEALIKHIALASEHVQKATKAIGDT
jgi:hypothetical protein